MIRMDITNIESIVHRTDPRSEREFRNIEDGRMLDPWESVWGCNFSVHKDQLIAINGFDRDYDGRWGAEDVDLAFRLIRKGLAVKPVPASIGYHIDHPSREAEGQRDLLRRKMADTSTRPIPKSWGNIS